MSKTYFVTGSAGFIGFHLTKKLLDQGHSVVSLDNLNPYYDPNLKKNRIAILSENKNFKFHVKDLSDKSFLVELLQTHAFDAVFHLAAQAGVRHSLENPDIYVRSNIDGTLNILEAARFSKNKPQLLMASSSSVYGLSQRFPFREDDPVDTPVALYGVTKRANELTAHSYSHLFGLRTTMLRFFTVYGAWGRPDMALFKFVRNILSGEEIELYNNGDMVRDFTYVDDIVDGIINLERARGASDQPLYDVFNIGCASPRKLTEYVAAAEAALGKKAKIKYGPIQPGDIQKTVADVSKLHSLTGYQPKTPIEFGVQQFVKWYLSYYQSEPPQ